MLLHVQLNFGGHLTYIANKLQKCLPKPLIPISKSLSHLISVMEKLSPDQQYNKLFHESLESLHCNASLTITGAIRDTWNENICQELGLESLMHRRSFRKLCTSCKIFKNQSPHYLCELLPLLTKSHNARLFRNIPLFHFNTTSSKTLFFLL